MKVAIMTPLGASACFALALAQSAEPTPPPGMSPAFAAIAGRQLPLEGAPGAMAGRHEVTTELAPDTPRFEVRRPTDLSAFPVRDRLPVLVWGNGGCSLNVGLAGGFLSTIASHGFLVVTTFGPEGVTRQATPQDLTAALDWAIAENTRAGSPLRGRIDVENVAMMGTSCGGYIALPAAADPRVDTLGEWSAGAGSMEAGLPLRTHMPDMAALKLLHGPALYINGGDADHLTPYSWANFEWLEHVPVFYGSRHDGGHSGTFGHPGGGEYANIAVDWLKWQLKGDATAGKTFSGADCGLCADRNWVVRRKGAPFQLPAAPSVDIGGLWKGSVLINGAARLTQWLQFDVLEGQLRGTVRGKLEGGDVSPAFEMQKLQLEGTHLAISAILRDTSGAPMPSEWQGTIDGKEIRFQVSAVLPGGGAAAYSLVVTRSPR